MANYVGPINVTPAHLEADNTFADGKEGFRLLTMNNQSIQLQGLASSTARVDYGNSTHLTVGKGNWGIVPVDTSSFLTDNDVFPHRGYYLIDTVEPEVKSGARTETKVAAEKVATFNDFLQMNFSLGLNDDSSQDFTYPPTIENITTLYDDHFTTATPLDYKVNDGASPGFHWCYGNSRRWTGQFYNDTTAPGKLVMYGHANTDGTEGESIWNSIGGFPYPHTVEWDFEVVATPTVANRYTRAVIYYSGGGPHPVQDLADVYSNAYYIRHNLTCFSDGMYAETGICLGNNFQWKYKYNITTRHPRFKIEQLEGGILTVWADAAGGSNWTQIYGPVNTGLAVFNYPHYAISYDTNWSGSDANVIKMDRFQIYQSNLSYGSRNNIVALPSNATLGTTPTFTRVAEGGDIPLYLNPSAPPLFKCTPTNFYDGSVKGYNANYSQGVTSLITREEEVLSPAKFYAKNGLIQLSTNTTAVTPIVLSYYSGGSWYPFQYIGTGGAITELKPLLISPEKQVYQINNTEWTLFRGKQTVRVEHPSTNLVYPLKSYYVHDAATITSPGSGVGVSMGTYHYTNLYNSTGDDYRSQIMKLNPTTIFTDSIPMDNVTGLGWYQNSAVSYNNASNLASEFLVQPLTKIGAYQL